MERPQALKSFYVMAHNSKNCYLCPYCILSCRDDLIEKNLEYSFEYDNNLPPPVSSIPVSINNYFGDPFLQKDDTFKKLGILEKSGHDGIVAIITKSYVNEEIIRQLKDTNLNIQVLYSISSTTDHFDGISYRKKIESLETLIHSGINASLYYRPIISGINDSEEMIRTILTDYRQIGGQAFCYSGLMGKQVVLDLLKMNGFNPSIPQGHKRWLEDKKLVPEGKKQFLKSKARELGLTAFMKTSCLASYKAGLSHDYNNHFYKPAKYECLGCVKYEDCKTFKDSLTVRDVEESLARYSLIFKDVEKEEHGACSLIKKCGHPTSECRNMSSISIHTGKITQGDESILKWVTGAMVRAEDIEQSCEVRVLDHLL